MFLFEHVFKTEVGMLTKEVGQVEQYWMEIARRYSQRGRYYHTLTHLNDIYGHLKNTSDQIRDWKVLVLSIAYHDIIYNVLKSDNEEKSAQLAAERMEKLNLTPAQRQLCVAQIKTTKTHEPTDDGDTNFFTDADLAILGGTASEYDQYTQLIRKEYRIFPDFVYKPGRQKVLRHFLEMGHIYKTVYFRDKFEKQARINLANELQQLLG